MPITLDGPRFAELPVPAAAPKTPSPALPHAGAGPSPFERVARGLSAAIDGGNRLVSKASSGGYAQMDAATLIALQAGIYRYSEAVDLCAKLVDRTASATRTVLEAGR